jgi:hypothetical protein
VLTVADLRAAKMTFRFPGHRPGGKRARRAAPEHQAQCAVFVWANHPLVLLRYPLLELLYAVPNGEKRQMQVAQRLKAEGVKAGIPDLQLPVPRGRWAGLYIEMKAGRNQPSPVQRRKMALLQQVGHRVSVQRTAEAAIAEIEWYLNLGRAA